MRSLLWFNLLRFCCWIAVLKSRQFKCHGIISVYEMRDGSDLWLRRHDDIAVMYPNHSQIWGCNDFPIMRGKWVKSEVSSSIMWPATITSEWTKESECVCSQWDVYALREQWSKTSSLNPKWTPPPSSHTQTLLHLNPFTNTTSTLYTHLLTHTHRDSHWAWSSWVTLALHIYIIENGLCCCLWKSVGVFFSFSQLEQ